MNDNAHLKNTDFPSKNASKPPFSHSKPPKTLKKPPKTPKKTHRSSLTCVRKTWNPHFSISNSMREARKRPTLVTIKRRGVKVNTTRTTTWLGAVLRGY
jgi:hypothetical protein